MRSLKPIYLALGFVGACSLVNKFDPVNDVPAAAGKGGEGGSGGSPIGEAGIGGSTPIAGSSSGGKGGTAGSTSGEGGEGGSTTGTPITGGLIVVGTYVGASPTTGMHFVVLIDPLTGKEITRTATTSAVLAIAYEAARDLWFVFTGTPGTSGDSTGPLLVGTMTSDGFNILQTVTVPKPTDQNTVAILNQRILYRSTKFFGGGVTATQDDQFTLLDTSAALSATQKVAAIAKLDIPYQYSTIGAVGSPLRGSTAGGRVFFVHDNPGFAANCQTLDAGAEPSCTVSASTLSIAAADKTTLTTPPITALSSLIDKDGSFPAIGIQPGGNTAVIVVPPIRAGDGNATVYRYNASTGGASSPVKFSLNGAGRMLDPTNPASIPGVAYDPCNDLLFAAELANTRLLYAIPIGSTAAPPVAFDPNTQNGTAATVTYEPYSKTLLNTNFDPTNPTFSGFQVTGTATAPTFIARGKAGALPWSPPNSLIPSVVVVRNPTGEPCN
jgi:hypothetical protein